MTLSRQSQQSNRDMSHPHDTSNARGTSHNRFQSAEISHQRCKRRTNLGHLSYMVPTPPRTNHPQGGASGNGMPTAVAKRNERERKRVRMVNNGFTTLRQHVPSGAKNKKLSKVETLRSAIDYIKHLQQVLGIYDMPLPTQHSDLDSISLEDEQTSMESSRSESMPVTNLDGADENVFPSPTRYQSEYGPSSYSNDSVTNAVTPYHVIPHYGGLNTCQYQGNYSHVAVGNCSVSPSMGLESNCHNMPNYNSGDELLNGVTTWFN